MYPTQLRGFSFETVGVNSISGFIGHHVRVSNRLSFQARLGVGYAWVEYERDDLKLDFSGLKFFKTTSDGKQENAYVSTTSDRLPTEIDDGGLYVEPGLELSWQLGRRWNFGLRSSYQIILGAGQIPSSGNAIQLLYVGLGLGFVW